MGQQRQRGAFPRAFSPGPWTHRRSGSQTSVLYGAEDGFASVEQFSPSKTCVYSHSMVLGGFELTSYTTRVTSRTSFTTRAEICSSTGQGRRIQSAVIASSDFTTRTAIVYP